MTRCAEKERRIGREGGREIRHKKKTIKGVRTSG